MAAPATNGFDFAAMKEFGQYLADVISEAVENTEAAEHWEQDKTNYEEALNNLLNCEESADPMVYGYPCLYDFCA